MHKKIILPVILLTSNLFSTDLQKKDVIEIQQPNKKTISYKKLNVLYGVAACVSLHVVVDNVADNKHILYLFDLITGFVIIFNIFFNKNNKVFVSDNEAYFKSALKKRDFKFAHRLIDQGFNFNCKIMGMTLIQSVIQNMNNVNGYRFAKKFVKLAFYNQKANKEKIKKEICSFKSKTPKKQHYEKIIKHLVENNAPIQYGDLLSAVKNNFEETAILLIDHGANINERDSFGLTSLHAAANNGSVTLVKKLINMDNIEINPTNQMGTTPLKLAFINGHNEIVNLFKQKGIKLKITNRLRNTEEFGLDAYEDDDSPDYDC